MEHTHNKFRRSSRRRGVTLLELIIALSVAAVSASIFYRLVVATTDLRKLNRENTVAADAARIVAEEMCAADFSELFALYNSDPSDDPDGPGTAPGSTFLVDGLPLPEGEAFHGTLLLPEATVEIQELVGEEQVTIQDVQLKEDLDLPELGLPRDLNGDSMVDSLDHSLEYLLLPVQIIVRWEGTHGTRTFELTTMLCAF